MVKEKYSRDGNFSLLVHTATAEVFKAIAAKYSAPDLTAKRPSVSSDISSARKAKLRLYGAGHQH
jgi:hypothetical protein